MTIEKNTKILDNVRLFNLNSGLLNNLKLRINHIPIRVRAQLANSILQLIKGLKNKYSAFSYFHLKYLLNEKETQLEVEENLKDLIKDYHKCIDINDIKYLFNIILDSIDSIGGGNIARIKKKYHIDYRTYKNLIFKNTEDYNTRFKTGLRNKGFIQKLANDIVESKISPKSFKNLMDPYIQTLRNYYENKFSLHHRGNLTTIFRFERIDNSFVQKFLSLSQITLRKIYSNANLEFIEILQLTRQMEEINMNNEIPKFVIYSLLKNNDINASKIGIKAGISNITVRHYAKKLSKLIDPRTNSPFINYNERIHGKDQSTYYMLRKSKISPAGFILQMPLEKRKDLINKTKEVIGILLNKYEYPYIIKKFLQENNQESKDYVFITTQLLKLSKMHGKLTYSDCFELFYIILEIYDYISAKSQSDISREIIRYKGFIKNIAKLCFQNPEDYKNRFSGTKYFKNKVLNIATNIISGKIDEDNITNVDSFEFQQILKAYRSDIVKLETEKLIQKGYPSIDSSAFKDRVRDIQRKNLFDRNFLGKRFIKWLEDLTDSELREIFKYRTFSIPKRDLLIMCNKINQNHEIFKYIIYLILKSQDSLQKIAKKSGKSHNMVRRIGKILDHNICPITNTYYLKSYEERFIN
ncbi:MAG: hypothetical protein ACFFC3_12365 [Candidatus Odinarchaeota archaeon]